MRLEGKVAIVTGAGRGQGQATAELFASEGAAVYAVDVVPGSYGTDAIKHRALDIRQEDEWAAVVGEVVAAEGKLDILVNNAGITGSSGPLSDTSLEDWDLVIQTNLTGTFLGMRAAVRQMQEQKSGAIVNVASIVALSPVPFVAPYHASKGGIRVLTKHAARAYATAGIRVNLILPGIIDTPMMEAAAADERIRSALIAGIPMGRIGRPSEVAHGSLFLASDDASYLTGAEIVIDGGAAIETALAAEQAAAFAALFAEPVPAAQ
jgi:NAD(P)-dependent dehydrogenase (short-subunit alcohol dehydrogenase family)